MGLRGWMSHPGGNKMIAGLLLPLLLASTPSVEIRVVESDGWGGGPPANIKAVLDATARDMLKYFPDRKLRPIIVSHGGGPPITLYALGPEGETQIHLNTTGLYWSQYAYQF